MPVVYCYSGDTRLVGGKTEAEGRLELCNNNRWGTVCGNTWRDNHTAVVCRYLGFSDVIGGRCIHKWTCIMECPTKWCFGTITVDSSYYTSERFGEGTGPIFIDYINCTGSESRLWGKCSHFTHYYGCSHNDDVGVQCQPGLWSRLHIKMENSSLNSKGENYMLF